jgi:hypothetical protein
MLMQLASSMPGTTAAAGQCRPAPVSAWHVEYLGPQDEGRASLQAFIAAAFLDTYGAEVSHFCDTLIGCRDADGRWIAALGFSLAGDGPTFLEQYLDAPLEQEIATRSHQVVRRQHIVEVGNLAAHHAGAARALIVSMTRFLHSQGLHWVAFTATASLLNSFTRLRLKPGVLAQADPARLPDAGKCWGSYYSTNPQVMFGDIRYGYAQLA